MTAFTPVTPTDPDDIGLVRDCPSVLRPFNLAGVLRPPDVHAARVLARLSGGSDGDEVLLAAALALRATRMGHVCVDLAGARETVSAAAAAPVDDAPAPPVDDATVQLDLPELAPWLAALRASALTSPIGGDVAPLRLVGPRLYLARYWHYEQRVIAAISARVAAGSVDIDESVLRDSLDRLYGAPSSDDLQRQATAVAVTKRLSVIAGGPGTGKTTTLAAVLACLFDQARGSDADSLRVDPPRIALTAPTGKAAARVNASLHAALERRSVAGAVAASREELGASTIHRLLGRRPGTQTGSATTLTIRSRTTSSSLTRRRWCRLP